MRKRLGNYIFAEDKQTLEGVIIESLKNNSQTISIAEFMTDGGINSRLSKTDTGGESLIYALASNNIYALCKSLEINHKSEVNLELAEQVALKTRDIYSTDFGFCVLINHTEKNEAETFIALSGQISQSRIGYFIGDNYRVTLGSIEMALDCIRRYFQGLPFDEKSDFER